MAPELPPSTVPPPPLTSRVSGRVVWSAAASFLAIVAISVLLVLLWQIRQILVLVVLSVFVATVLAPLVVRVGRLLHVGRALSATIVYLAGLAIATGLGFLFVAPLYRAARRFADDAPELLRTAEQGRGPFGGIVRRYHIEEWVSRNAHRLPDVLKQAGGPAVKAATAAVSGLAALVIVAVLSFMILVEAPMMLDRGFGRMADHRAERVRRVGRDVARTVTGYVTGSLLTSLIAGTTMALTLLVLGVPFAFLAGVWVFVFDLLPLVGVFVAGIPIVIFAALHEPRSGIVVGVVFFVYQQIENHVLTPMVMSRTVRLNPLWVLLSILVGAQLGSIVGALLAIPVAGAIQVIGQDVWRQRHPPVIREGDGATADPAGSEV